MSPEEQAAYDEDMREVLAGWEEEATSLFGPPEVRARKNWEYADRPIAEHSEPVIRGMLVALSHLQDPQCAKSLSEIDLEATPLDEIIQPFELLGTSFEITRVEGGEYTVQISAGYHLAGGGAEFLLTRDGDQFSVKPTGLFWMN